MNVLYAMLVAFFVPYASFDGDAWRNTEEKTRQEIIRNLVEDWWVKNSDCRVPEWSVQDNRKKVHVFIECIKPPSRKQG